MSTFDKTSETNEILKLNQNLDSGQKTRVKSISQNTNIIVNKEEDENLNKSDSDIEVNITTYPLKICFVGNSNVGKTSIILRFVKDKFDAEKITTTLTGAYENKKLKIDTFTELNMQIWDTAGQERFRSLTSGFLRGSDGVFLVFDLSDSQSFEDLNSWLDEIKNSDIKTTCVKMLIGNKLDVKKREIDDETAQKFAEEKGMKYMSVSAKDGINILSMFETIGNSCLKAIQEDDDNTIKKKKLIKSQKPENKDRGDKSEDKSSVNISNKAISGRRKKNERCC